MEEGEPKGPPVVEYESVRERGERRQLVRGYLVGVLGAPGLTFLSAAIGSLIDAARNPGAYLSGLGGLILGGTAGIVLVIVAAAAAFLSARRRHSAVLRGVGQGLLLCRRPTC